MVATLLLMTALVSPVEAGLQSTATDFFSFDAGADLRVRQEIMHNVPLLPAGGMQSNGAIRGKTRNHFRIRPRVWAEVKMGENWRFYTRLADEMRAGIAQSSAVHVHTWPGEVFVDNLFLEGKGLFDDRVDVIVGRHDINNMFGLDHIFTDPTAGDGSRAFSTDLLRVTFRPTEDSTLDVFGFLNKDRDYMRFGTKRSRYGIQRTGFGGNDTEMDDWAFGVVWGSNVNLLDYQLFWIQKNTASFHRRGVKHPRRQVNLLGTKLVPHWTENFSTPVEVMAQVGQNGRDEELCAWSTYTGIHWTDRSKETWRPFISTGLHIMSGDKDAATEDGGRHAWDPMWYRAADDSEMFPYGSLYGTAWFSNLYNFKTTLGYDIGRHHRVSLMFGPLFVQQKDGLGGGDGSFKGFLTRFMYAFPLWDKEDSRFKVLSHVMVEYFNPGDYYATDKPAYFVRWQIEFKF